MTRRSFVTPVPMKSLVRFIEKSLLRVSAGYKGRRGTVRTLKAVQSAEPWP